MVATVQMEEEVEVQVEAAAVVVAKVKFEGRRPLIVKYLLD